MDILWAVTSERYLLLILNVLVLWICDQSMSMLVLSALILTLEMTTEALLSLLLTLYPPSKQTIGSPEEDSLDASSM